MKFLFSNNLLPVIGLSFLFLFLVSCSEEEIPFNPTDGLVKIGEGYALGAAAKVQVWASEDLYAGYNQVFITAYDSMSGKAINEAHINLKPLMTMTSMSHSCPVINPEEASVKGLFEAAVLFTMPSGDMGKWSMEVNFHNHQRNALGKLNLDLQVKSTTPSRVTSFATASGKKYYLSYRFQDKVKVGVNDIDIIAFTMENGKFIPAEGLTMVMSPEMPSMDHGSPNNTNPVYTMNGIYSGKSNFTMSGEWVLNLALTDETGDLGSRTFTIIVN